MITDYVYRQDDGTTQVRCTDTDDFEIVIEMKDFLRNVRMREFEFHEWLDNKLKQVRLEEREACAKVCEPVEGSAYELGVYKTMQTLAAAIRARGEK